MPVRKKRSEEYIKFLGTAGARFVMINQLRASGGLWISASGKNIIVDPGPGSIVRCSSSRPKLDPTKLDAIILTHKHLDHSGDINVMIEAMAEGGFKKRGIVFTPQDALEEGPVILQYLRTFPEQIVLLKEKTEYRLGDLVFQSSMKHIHPVETYGMKFDINGTSIGLLSDTRYFPELEEFYKTDILIISVVFNEPHPGIDHLCLADAERIITQVRPRKAILTHFGMRMLQAKPHIQAELLSQHSGVEVVAAYDGMTVGL
ncbi:MAG: MBL fold metallo-hydrolase [Candidatus Omnitrophica bacterium]|nr:MBL fold metallo-hydrolase [Candidatus Omnitrophota bacterium]MDD5655029.1 MBL fold metallo-hydrolase [Candidatus Omnitrophota bacterium]